MYGKVLYSEQLRNLEEDHCFWSVALCMWAIKEDDPLLISTLMHCNIIVLEWGYSLDMERSLE